MANKLAKLKLTLTYAGPSGEPVAPPTSTVNVPYQAQTVGSIDVEDGSSADDYEVPFGAIEKLNLAWIENLTGQECTVTINGDLEHKLPTGAHFLPLVSASAPSTGITSLTISTLTTQAGDGTIAYRLFGDST
jgi:hypothetical protein